MIVYVLTEEPYHDNSSIVGVFATVEEAKAAAPPNDTWQAGGIFTSDIDGALSTDEDKTATRWCIRPYVIHFDGSSDG